METNRGRKPRGRCVDGYLISHVLGTLGRSHEELVYDAVAEM
jgi:hypothetical protein